MCWTKAACARIVLSILLYTISWMRHYLAGSIAILRHSHGAPSLWIQIFPLVTVHSVASFISLPLTMGRMLSPKHSTS